MEKNIFEGAYFGKPYKTRDCRKAIYHMGHDKNFHELILPDGILLCNDDGYSRIKEENRDIVSEWQEEINEEELDMLAEIYVDNYGCQTSRDGVDIYKAGYYKALSQLTNAKDCDK